MLKYLRNNRQVIITGLLLAVLICGGSLPARLDSVVFYVIVFGVALIVSTKHRLFRTLLAVSAVSFACAWTNTFHDQYFNILYGISSLICLLYVIIFTIQSVINNQNVSVGEVFALVNCYLIAGFFWGLLYVTVNGFAPGSFLIHDNPERIRDAFISLSFGTMTTLGYAGVAPVSILAQRLCLTEAIFGQFYFTLVVAYLLNKLFHHRMSGR